MWFWGIVKINLQNLKTFFLKVRSEKHMCKPKYGSIWSRALDSCCIPSVPLRIARAPLEDRAFENGVKEGCSYSYDLEIVAGLYDKKWKTRQKDDRNNNDLQVGCFITINFPCADGETAGSAEREKHWIGRRGDILPQFLLKNKTREWTDDVTRFIGGRMSLGKGETYSQIRTL